jgi:hypothetical protein
MIKLILSLFTGIAENDLVFVLVDADDQVHTVNGSIFHTDNFDTAKHMRRYLEARYKKPVQLAVMRHADTECAHVKKAELGGRSKFDRANRVHSN